MALDLNQSTLINGCTELGLTCDKDKVEQLLTYLALFEKWNKAFNLSAIRNPSDMVNLHLLDSLSVAPHLQGRTWVDVGTGGGLPGIPLAIFYPENQYTLVDSAGKKTRFLHQVIQELSLTNVDVIHTRAETLEFAEGVDGVISRAFASLNEMIRRTHHLLNSSGRFWAMKGQTPIAELSQIEKGYIVTKVQPLTVPGVNAERCLITIQPDLAMS